MSEYTIQSIIEFQPCSKDLRKYRESWVGSSYAVKKAEISNHVFSQRGKYPSKNMRYIREGIFLAPPETSIEDLQNLAELIRKEFGIDCFQIGIEGVKKSQVRVHMLFSWYDYVNEKVFKITSPDMSFISVMILHELHLPISDDFSPTWHRYAIRNLYRENKNCFKELGSVCKTKGLTRQQNILLRECMTFLELMCKKSLR